MKIREKWSNWIKTKVLSFDPVHFIGLFSVSCEASSGDRSLLNKELGYFFVAIVAIWNLLSERSLFAKVSQGRNFQI